MDMAFAIDVQCIGVTKDMQSMAASWPRFRSVKIGAKHARMLVCLSEMHPTTRAVLIIHEPYLKLTGSSYWNEFAVKKLRTSDKLHNSRPTCEYLFIYFYFR